MTHWGLKANLMGQFVSGGIFINLSDIKQFENHYAEYD